MFVVLSQKCSVYTNIVWCLASMSVFVFWTSCIPVVRWYFCCSDCCHYFTRYHLTGKIELDSFFFSPRLWPSVACPTPSTSSRQRRNQRSWFSQGATARGTLTSSRGWRTSTWTNGSCSFWPSSTPCLVETKSEQPGLIQRFCVQFCREKNCQSL